MAELTIRTAVNAINAYRKISFRVLDPADNHVTTDHLAVT